MRFLVGTNAWAATLFFVSLAIIIALFVATGCAVAYHRIIYRKFRRTRYDQSFRPTCAIIIPCKGLPKDLKGNLESFLNLDYPAYRVLFSVESEKDPAVEVIRQVVNANPSRCALVVAGLSKTCAQKNFNQLAAIRQARDPEVYVFADADIGPKANWLRELVLPLSVPKVAAATGFRWQFSPNGKLGEQVHAAQNNVLYVLFCFISAIGRLDLVWGGAMAIRKSDFDNLGVAKLWSETVVDDFSLSKIIMRSPQGAILVPTAVTVTDDAIETFMQAVKWYERQTMFLKFFHRKTWACAAIPGVLLFALIQMWLPAALLLSAALHVSFWSLGGGGALLFWLGAFASTVMYPLLGANPTFGGFVLCLPVSLFAMFYGALRTVFTNTISWGGIKYKLARGGLVTSIERPAE